MSEYMVCIFLGLWGTLTPLGVVGPGSVVFPLLMATPSPQMASAWMTSSTVTGQSTTVPARSAVIRSALLGQPSARCSSLATAAALISLFE
jgi:hypothetical protein